ncbi:MAG: hypothetical protein INR65_18310 [Gluconacetobacter diazotrophicus]|nr:hypothetical protein [Gluconacetobacter diazotrophicus]
MLSPMSPAGAFRALLPLVLLLLAVPAFGAPSAGTPAAPIPDIVPAPSATPATARTVAAPAPALPTARFAAPVQPWRSPDGHVALLRPAIAAPTTSDAPLGALMGRGWRLSWDGRPTGPGRVLVRLALPTVPAGTELLQVGASDDPATVRACLSSLTGTPVPARDIAGVRYAVRTNADSGMNQTIAATDLRAVVGSRCYAIERLRYASAPGVQDPAPNAIPRARAAALLDAALASLRISASTVQPPEPAALRLPPNAVAR